MEKVKLTQALVSKLQPPASGKDCYSDSETAGLYLTITRRGVKSFSYVRRVGGRVGQIGRAHV